MLKSRFKKLLLLAICLGFCPFLLGWTTGDKLDFKYMYYWDKNKVWNHTPTLVLLKSLSEKWKFGWNQELDAVSGASRRLGLRNIGRQGDNDLKLDGLSGASKREIRHSEKLSVKYSNDGRDMDASFYYSDESDYTSYSPSFSLAWDFNRRNTTLGADVALFYDELHPQGEFKGLGGKRDIQSISLSLTQLLSIKSLASFTANLIQSNGVLGHPYTPVILANGNMLLEKLPNAKTSLALAGQYIIGFNFLNRLSSVHSNFRLYRDSWELLSYTGDFQFFHYVTGNSYFRLSTRLYHQSGAAFAKTFYSGNELYHTSDIRLHKFSFLNLGLKFASRFPESWQNSSWLPHKWDVGYEYGWRDTKGEDNGFQPFSRYQLYPSNENYMQGIFMLGVGYEF